VHREQPALRLQQQGAIRAYAFDAPLHQRAAIEQFVNGAMREAALGELFSARLHGGLVRNLADNAVRYSPPGSRVQVRVGLEGDAPALWIDDAGPGIPPAEREHVFDRFYRADPSREAGSRTGAGLGLAIARGIVLAHGGDISVQSQPGEGACFTIRLPRDHR
jgi:K+-sensing histidine kinase KdpD